jgi:hypothetical protein
LKEHSGEDYITLAFQGVDTVRLYYIPGRAVSKWQIRSGMNALVSAEDMSCINKHAAHQMPIPDFLKQELSLFVLCRYHSVESLLTRLCDMTVSLARKIVMGGGV